MCEKMLDFIYESPSAFNAIENFCDKLDENGYQRISEKDHFELKKGGKYYVTRNGSSIIAFNIGTKLNKPQFKIVASHSDCPSFKLKPNTILNDKKYTRLNTEIYGGPILSTWFDRPLSLAGRLIVREDGMIKTRTFNLDEDFCMIPSVAIHMNPEANKGYKNNPQVDMLPLVNLDEEFDLLAYLKEKSGMDVINYDLYLYPRMKGYIWSNKELFSSFHIDNLECAYTSFEAFKDTFEDDAINVLAIFDNEEVGSLTRQGADSDFMYQILNRISDSLNLNYYELIANSMLISADNAHSVHPNHNELADPSNRPYMNKGIVIKYNANQSYTSDALSASIFSSILDDNKIPYQYFTNRSDARGGSTLGNISNSHASLVSVDIGLAQIAMHSCFETAGVKDIEYMIDGLKAFYKTYINLPE